MHISNITIPFVKLAEVLGLPDNATIVAVKEHNEGTHFVVRVAADVMPSDCVLGPDDSLKKIGLAYESSQTSGVVVGGGSSVVQGVEESELEPVDGQLVEDDTPLGEIISPTVVS